jgi:hypothetical protein
MVALIVVLMVALPASTASAIRGGSDARVGAPRDPLTLFRTIRGYPAGQAGLGVWLDPCVSGDSPPVDHESAGNWRFLIERKPASQGLRYIGFKPTEQQYEMGVSTFVSDPASVRRLAISAFAKSGSISGDATISFYPDDGTVWVGQSPIRIDAHQADLEADGLSFEWRHYSDGAYVESAPDNSIGSFIGSHGGNQGGARLGFEFGCNGNTFYFDELKVTTESVARAFDFEGYKSRVAFRAKSPTQFCQVSALQYPNKVTFSTKAQFKDEAGHWRAARENLLMWNSSAGEYGRTLHPRDWASSSLKLRENTRFYIDFTGSDPIERSYSEPLYFRVFPKISLSSSVHRVSAGQPMRFSGQINPSLKFPYKILVATYKKKGWGPYQVAARGVTSSSGKLKDTVARAPGSYRVTIMTSDKHGVTSTVARSGLNFVVTKPHHHDSHQPSPSPDPPSSPETPTEPPAPPSDPPPPEPGHRASTSCGWFPIGSHLRVAGASRPASGLARSGGPRMTRLASAETGAREARRPEPTSSRLP